MGIESSAVRVGGFRNQPGNPNFGEGKTVTHGNRVYTGDVEITGAAEFGAADFSTAPTVDGRVTTRDAVVVSPAGGGDVLANTFGSVTLAGVLVSDERVIGYDFPSTGLLVGLTFEGFRILTGTDVEFVWQNVTVAGLTIPQLTWTLTIGRV